MIVNHDPTVESTLMALKGFLLWWVLQKGPEGTSVGMVPGSFVSEVTGYQTFRRPSGKNKFLLFFCVAELGWGHPQSDRWIWVTWLRKLSREDSCHWQIWLYLRFFGFSLPPPQSVPTKSPIIEQGDWLYKLQRKTNLTVSCSELILCHLAPKKASVGTASVREAGDGEEAICPWCFIIAELVLDSDPPTSNLID